MQSNARCFFYIQITPTEVIRLTFKPQAERNINYAERIKHEKYT